MSAGRWFDFLGAQASPGAAVRPRLRAVRGTAGIGKSTPGTTTGTSPRGARTIVVTRQAIDRDGLRLPRRCDANLTASQALGLGGNPCAVATEVVLCHPHGQCVLAGRDIGHACGPRPPHRRLGAHFGRPLFRDVSEHLLLGEGVRVNRGDESGYTCESRSGIVLEQHSGRMFAFTPSQIGQDDRDRPACGR